MIKTISNNDTNQYKKIICYTDSEDLSPSNIYLISNKKSRKKLEVYNCECGGKFNKYQEKNHKNSISHQKFLINNNIDIRQCKKCNLNLNINNFQITSNKKSKNTTYRHICKKCITIKKSEYMKDYHKEKYKSKKENL